MQHLQNRKAYTKLKQLISLGDGHAHISLSVDNPLMEETATDNFIVFITKQLRCKTEPVVERNPFHVCCNYLKV